MDRLDERRLFRLAGNQCRAGVTTRFHVADMIHSQAAFLLGVAVAFVAAVDQNRPDFLFEKDHGRTLGIIIRCKSAAAGKAAQNNKGIGKSEPIHVRYIRRQVLGFGRKNC